MKNIKLKIGELGQLCRVSTRTILHYENIGLLEPCSIDSHTNYRYYGTGEMKKLFLILQLKDLGFTLSEIEELFKRGSWIPDVACLEQKIQRCEQELERLQFQHKQLKEFLVLQQLKEMPENIYIDKLPAITVAYHNLVFSNYDELGELLGTKIVPEMVRLGCRLPEPRYRFTRDISEEFKEGKMEIEYCERVIEARQESELIRFKQLPEVPTAICMKVYGPHAQLEAKRIQLLTEIAKRDYHIVGAPRYNYVDGIWNQKNPKKWLTVIQVPIEAKNIDSVQKKHLKE